MTLTIINILTLFIGGVSFAFIIIAAVGWVKPEAKENMERLMNAHERRADALERIANLLAKQQLDK